MSRTIYEVIYDENIQSDVIDVITYPSDLIEIPLTQSQIDDIGYYDAYATTIISNNRQ